MRTWVRAMFWGQGWSIGAAALVLFVSAARARKTPSRRRDRARPSDGGRREDASGWRSRWRAKFEKDATLKAQGLDVTVVGGKVTLTGTTGVREGQGLRPEGRHSRSRASSEVDNQILVRGSKEAAKPAGDRAKRKAAPRDATEPREMDTMKPRPTDPRDLKPAHPCCRGRNATLSISPESPI